MWNTQLIFSINFALVWGALLVKVSELIKAEFIKYLKIIILFSLYLYKCQMRLCYRNLKIYYYWLVLQATSSIKIIEILKHCFESSDLFYISIYKWHWRFAK